MSEKEIQTIEKVEVVEKQKPKKNFIKNAFTSSYKYENLVLLILAIIAMVLGFMVLVGDLQINEKVYFIGEYPMVFAWILFILGTVSLLLSIWPFFKPSVGELKRVSWPGVSTVLKNTAIVFAYTLILAIFFVGADALLNQVVKLFQWLAGLMR